jgi:hypothetical protein
VVIHTGADYSIYRSGRVRVYVSPAFPRALEAEVWVSSARRCPEAKALDRTGASSVRRPRGERTGKPRISQRALNALSPDLAGVLPALRRAAAAARELSIRTGTPFWVMKDGRLVDLNAKRSAKRPGRAVARARARRR